MNFAINLQAVASIARKEMLHILRDRRILVLVLTLPPMFTLIFGYAFEDAELKGVPSIIVNADGSPLSEELVTLLKEKEAFAWREMPYTKGGETDLLTLGASARIVIPPGWSEHLADAEPLRVEATLDGTDTNTAVYLEGHVREALGELQLRQRDAELANLPPAVQAMLAESASPWEIDRHILYNPEMKVIDFVTPGIIGLILQLLTVTLMACTITRERESGTLSQLRVTSLTRLEIVIGKVVPYLGLSIVLILIIIAVAAFHFHVPFRDPLALSVICLLFLLCSLGLGLVISAISDTQTQAIQIAVLFLLPVFPLSGAFAPLERLPPLIQGAAQIFPLTHFCHAFRLVNLGGAGWSMIGSDLAFLVVGALASCIGAAMLLNATDD